MSTLNTLSFYEDMNNRLLLQQEGKSEPQLTFIPRYFLCKISWSLSYPNSSACRGFCSQLEACSALLHNTISLILQIQSSFVPYPARRNPAVLFFLFFFGQIGTKKI